MEGKVFGAVIAAISIFAIILSLLSQKNDFIILNLAFVAFVAGVFINFLNQ